MKSLLIIGLPRGFSSEAYRIAAAMLPDLQQSAVAAGEVLNHQRNPDLADAADFYLGDESPDFEFFYRQCEVQLLRYAEDFIIKDVVQPWVVLRFLKEHPGLYHVLFADRDLAQIKFALERKGWAFVRHIDTIHQSFQLFPSIDVSHAQFDAEVFHRALVAIYPAAQQVNYIDNNFIVIRDRFLTAFNCAHWDGTFRSIDRSELFQLQGFSTFDSGLCGCWSCRQKVNITINMHSLAIAPGALKIKCSAPLRELNRELTLTFIIEGSTDSFSFAFTTSQQVFTIPLPDNFTDKILMLHIENSELLSPLQLGLSDDARTLGAGVLFIGFDAKPTQSSAFFPRLLRQIKGLRR